MKMCHCSFCCVMFSLFVAVIAVKRSTISVALPPSDVMHQFKLCYSHWQNLQNTREGYFKDLLAKCRKFTREMSPGLNKPVSVEILEISSCQFSRCKYCTGLELTMSLLSALYIGDFLMTFLNLLLNILN